MLAAGRIDAVIGTEYVIAYAIEHDGMSREVFSNPFEIGHVEFLLYGRKNLSEDVIARLQAAIKIMEKSMYAKNIVLKYRYRVPPTDN